MIEKVAKSSDTAPHFTQNLEKTGNVPSQNEEDYALPHPIWSREQSESVEIVHRKPEGFVDHMVSLSWGETLGVEFVCVFKPLLIQTSLRKQPVGVGEWVERPVGIQIQWGSEKQTFSSVIWS